MKATVDPDLCILCGLCWETCPEVFEEGPLHSMVKTDPVPKEQEDCARTAAENCPVSAIRLEE